jgi:hypothetical protein
MPIPLFVSPIVANETKIAMMVWLWERGAGRRALKAAHRRASVQHAAEPRQDLGAQVTRRPRPQAPPASRPAGR